MVKWLNCGTCGCTSTTGNLTRAMKGKCRDFVVNFYKGKKYNVRLLLVNVKYMEVGAVMM